MHARLRNEPHTQMMLRWHGPLFEQDRPASLIFICWVGAVQRLLDRSSIEGRPFTHWHAELRRALLARAPGHVAAHETGHLMCGPTHAPGGL